MTGNNADVAIYKSHIEAKSAIKELPESGFDMNNTSATGNNAFNAWGSVLGLAVTSAARPRADDGERRSAV